MFPGINFSDNIDIYINPGMYVGNYDNDNDNGINSCTVDMNKAIRDFIANKYKSWWRGLRKIPQI